MVVLNRAGRGNLLHEYLLLEILLSGEYIVCQKVMIKASFILCKYTEFNIVKNTSQDKTRHTFMKTETTIYFNKEFNIKISKHILGETEMSTKTLL